MQRGTLKDPIYKSKLIHWVQVTIPEDRKSEIEE